MALTTFKAWVFVSFLLIITLIYTREGLPAAMLNRSLKCQMPNEFTSILFGSSTKLLYLLLMQFILFLFLLLLTHLKKYLVLLLPFLSRKTLSFCSARDSSALINLSTCQAYPSPSWQVFFFLISKMYIKAKWQSRLKSQRKQLRFILPTISTLER